MRSGKPLNMEPPVGLSGSNGEGELLVLYVAPSAYDLVSVRGFVAAEGKCFLCILTLFVILLCVGALCCFAEGTGRGFA